MRPWKKCPRRLETIQVEIGATTSHRHRRRADTIGML